MEQDTNVFTTNEEESIVFDASDFGLEEQNEENSFAQDGDSEANEGAGEGKEAARQDKEAQGKAQEADEQKAADGDNSDTHEKERTDGEAKTDGGEIEVNFLGEKRKLTIEEAAKLAQKGLNYDHVKEERDALKENALFKAAALSQKHSGMSEQEFADYLKDRANEFQIKKISKERGIDEEAAKVVLEALSGEEVKNSKTKQDLDELKRQNDELMEFKRISDIKEQMRREWNEFSKAHPQYSTMDDLPLEVKDAIKAGEELDAAYMRYENSKLKTDLKRLEAAAKTPGSVSGMGEGEQEDDFLKGFFGKY